MADVNRQWLLRKRPSGMVREDDFELVESPVPQPGEDEVVVRNCYLAFEPAMLDVQTGEVTRPARARCCTSDLTLAEFLRLEGRMDAANRDATDVAQYLDATPRWRTDLYSNAGTLMTHADSIALFDELGVAMVPELKQPMVEMPWQGEYSQRDYALDLLAAYQQADIGPDRVQMQSFDQHLTELYRAGTISLEVAKIAASNPSDFERALNFSDVSTMSEPQMATGGDLPGLELDGGSEKPDNDSGEELLLTESPEDEAEKLELDI